jgi:hypothetical protein
MERVTAFHGDEIVGSGAPADVMRLVEERYAPSDLAAIRAYDDETGRVVDLDFRDAGASAQPPRGRGRPRLGVAAREVTLLPRHWDWLSRQRGGASGTLRRLVEEASRVAPSAEERRDAAYRFMADRCGDRPGYEEALRSLYRGERDRFDALTAPWPEAIRDYLGRLLG